MEELDCVRIALRLYREDDAVHIYEWTRDPGTTRWMGRKFRNPRSLEEIREGVAKIVTSPPEDAAFFVIAEASNGEYLGAIDLTSIDWIDGNGVLSMVIAKEVDRGKGIGAQAIRLMLHHAFTVLHLHKVELRVSAGNVAALRCYQKIGFKIEGTIRDHEFVDGAYRDLLQMGILETEFSS